jgi:hypothetical protein
MSVFVPEGNGFKKLTSIPTTASMNSVCEHLGYHIDQFFIWLGDFDNDFDINVVALEIFSRNIIYVSTKAGVEIVDSTKLKCFLRNLTDTELYKSYTVEDSLKEGIANKSLTSIFLKKVLGDESIESDGVFFASKLNLYLYFNNGYLVDFQSSDGLGKWAKHWKEISSEFIANYEAEAKKYWGNNQKQLLSEVNTQSDALAGVPQAVSNEFTPLHTDKNGLVNFRMLLACHYDQPISLEDFLVLNHGRYEELAAQSKYRLGRFDYLFSNDGTLIHSIMH